MADEGDASGKELGKSRRWMAVAIAAMFVASALAAYTMWPRGGPAPPGLLVPAPPTNPRAAADDGIVTVSWDASEDATAYHVYMASAPGVTKAGYAAKPDGARFADVAAPYSVSGLANGRTYYFRVTAENEAGESAESAEASATPRAPPSGMPLYVTGLVELDSGAPAVGAPVTVRSEDGSVRVQGLTGLDGRFNVGLDVSFPLRVLAEVTYQGAIGPSAVGFRWSPILDAGGAVDVGRILVPDPSSKRLMMAGGVAAAADGTIVVTDLPSNVASLWARVYDPDALTDVFPGDFAEGRDFPLNSFGFLWISALDTGGAPVVDVDPPATVRMAVPQAQWVDIEDLQPGNGAINIPIYSFDYGTAYWVREASGRVTDFAGNPVPESQGLAIRLGTYAGEVYAEFHPGHFSWWNLDKTPSKCTSDFGDADDPPYPSLLASDGARHRNICRAWLGRWVDAEDDAHALNGDLYDDGVLGQEPLVLGISNWDWSGYLYLNVLLDQNSDGDWTDAGEWALQNLPASVPTGKGKAIETDVVWDARTWMRVTLTGEIVPDYNGTGDFAIGETEDYPFLKHTLSVWVTGNGTVTSDPTGIDCRTDSGPCRADYQDGTVVNLTATPDSGESFIEWGGDCEPAGSNATCTLVMEEDRQVYASFTAPYYNLSVYVTGNNQTGYGGGGNVTSEPPGIRCGGGRPDPGGTPGNCTAFFPRDSTVVLTATPDPGWTFVGWGGDCTGTSPTCTLFMDRDKWVIAYFAKT